MATELCSPCQIPSKTERATATRTTSKPCNTAPRLHVHIHQHEHDCHTVNHQFQTVSLHIRTPRFAKKPVKAPDRAAAGNWDSQSDTTMRGVPLLNKVCAALTLSLMRACTQTDGGHCRTM